MSTASDDEFDVLTFFIIVMVVLTGIVGLFAYLLYGRVQKQTKLIKREIKNLNELQDLAIKDDFINWIQREREGKNESGSPNEFYARIVASARRFRIRTDRVNQQPRIERRGFEEIPFSVTIKNCQLEPLVKFLHDVEEKWVGAKVKQLQVNYRDKEKAWSAEATISLFKTNTEG